MKGKIKTSKKFLGFVRRRGPGSDRALVDGRLFSHPGKAFEMVVHDDGTVDLCQVGGDEFSAEELSRFVQMIEDMDVAGMDGHWVVGGVRFEDPSGKSRPHLSLSVEVAKPFDTLQEILGEAPPTVTKRQATRLAMLLGELPDDTEPDPGKPAPAVESAAPAAADHSLGAAFERMKEEKMAELASSLTAAEARAAKHTHEARAAESLAKAAQSEADLLRGRIRSLGVRPSPNGLLFHVSESAGERPSLDEDTIGKIRSAVSKVKSINADAFMGLFAQGEYLVTLYRAAEGGPERVEGPGGLGERAAATLSSLGMSYRGDGFVYSGELDWHSLVDHFVCAGFEHLTRQPATKK